MNLQTPIECCIFLILLIFPHTGQIQFTQKYQGGSVTALVGSSVNFTWGFAKGNGGITGVEWVLSNSNTSYIVNNGKLVSLDPSGNPVSVPVAAGFGGHVFGRLVGNKDAGQVIFTLSSIKKSFGRLYGCVIYPESSFDLEQFDTVNLDVQAPPSIIQTSPNQTVNEGEIVTLNCKADGNPTPNINWRRLSDASVVTMPLSISKQSEGGYRCTADNKIGSAAWGDVFITVQYKPKGVTITTSTAGNIATQGQDVTLACHVTEAKPAVSEYRFYLSDSILTPVTNVNKFIIHSVNRSQHFGKYKCVAHNDAGDGQSDVVVLNITVPVEILWMTGNLTVNETNSINLRCDATGYPSPVVTWRKVGGQIYHGSMLHIGSSTKKKSGTYICVADNVVGRAEMKTFVTVQYQAAITSAKASETQSWIGQTIQLECVADGVPTPTITWKTPNGREIKKDGVTRHVANVSMENDQDFGNYTCGAENGVGVAATSTTQVNQIKAPGSPSITVEIEATSLTVRWTAPAYDGGSPITGYQAVILHGGKVIENKTLGAAARKHPFFGLNRSTNYTVKVSARNKVFQGDASELKIKTKYEGPPAAVEILDFPAETEETKVTLMWNEPENNGAPITKYTVYQRTVSDGLPGDWIEIKEITNLTDRKVIVQQLEKDKVYEFAVTATNLYGESLIAEKTITKIKVLGDIPEPVVITEALNEDGKITLKWQKPEENGAAIVQYSKYQRNADEEQWTNRENITDTDKRSYVFNVKKGEKYEFVMTATNKYGESEKTNVQEVEVLAVITKPPENQRGSCGIVHVVYISAMVLLVIAIVFLLLLVWRMRRRPCPRCGDLIAMNPVATKAKEDTQPSNWEWGNEPPTYATPVVRDYMPLHPSGRSWEISREQVTVIKVIGKGAFSQVAQATVRNMRGGQENKTVAVKMLKEDAPDSDRKDLLSELELMKKLKPHPHVIKLIGCVTRKDPLLVLIEYVPFGDLLGYLRKSRGLNDTYYKDPDVKPQTNLTAEQLMKFAWQVADGMCYLSSKKIIHRDLAARNILVGEGEVCKVTDFGMARNANQDDIYTRKSRGRLPVKWTAYEALLYGTYTTQSDVWSYGILLYEILTVGASPYPNVNARHIARKIQEGYRMPKPRHVDSKLFGIMLKCWEENPNDRPTFDELRKTMKDMGRKHKTYVNLSEYDNRLYVNLSDLTAE